jgi:hypothetical protein
MALGNKVALIPTMSIDLGGGDQVIRIACHQATCYWLYEEAKGQPPTGAVYGNGILGSQSTMQAIKALGLPVRNAMDLNQKPAGTVLLFVDMTGEPQHSCVIATNGDLGGYNQPLWLFGGQPNMFSMHPRSAIAWDPRTVGGVRPYQKPVHYLYAVDEAAAVTYAMINF